ncbi:MAG: RNA pseudouridine synthase [Planctomycetota bacterium]|nr:RNA pseudouridine synthase [Planctomycetota bacterium]
MSPKLPEIEFLLEEGAVLVVNKPAGILTQAPPEIDSMELRLKRFLKLRDEKPGKVYLGVPHRLDRPVSGVMVFAKNVRATRRLAEQFEYRSIVKKYWALVEGHPSEDSGEWVDYMRKIPGQAMSEILPEDDPNAQLAILKYRTLEKFQDRSLLEIRLETGRTHQIRLQCGSRKLPIVGDLQYGAQTSFGPPEPDARKRRIGLHARSLKFEHPMTRDFHFLTAPLSGAWMDLSIQEH